jgi:phosphomannomutase
MLQIKFGTDGWRAIIADDFTVDNVKRVAEGTALRLKQDDAKPAVVVGHDCRFGGELFAETTARVLAAHGIKVYLSRGITSTPMISLGTVKLKAQQGVIITASHNPASYNGYKLKSSYGGPSVPSFVAEVEDLIPSVCNTALASMAELLASGQIEIVQLEDMYCQHVEENFDMEAIKKSGLNFAYDAMYGAGQNVMRRLFPEITFLHCDWNPGFDGQAPEPIHKNLTEFSELIRISEDIDCGLATDGDADRIGLYNAKGEFVDSHHIILLLISYLHKEKGFGGDVIKSFSCCSRIDKMCEAYGLKSITTKIGFKYICELMVSGDALVGGEESGGIAIKGHIPERDGIWIGLTIWEMMAKSGKSLNDLIEEVYSIVGSFAVERYDEHVENNLKNAIIENCKNGTYQSFGDYTVQRVEDTDGFKFHLSEHSWVMLRASGTEPVLRIYAEAENSAASFKILDAVKATLLN